MNGGMIDGSWELRVLVTDLQVERTLRVKSDLHIGGVMIQLVDELGKLQILHLSAAAKFNNILSDKLTDHRFSTMICANFTCCSSFRVQNHDVAAPSTSALRTVC